MDLDIPDLSSLFNKIILGIRHWQFGTKAQLAFLEDLYLLINDGIPANRAIEMMTQVTTGLPREVALNIAQKISEGQPLAEGMREWFSPNIIEIIHVGEEGGALAETLRSAINTLTQRSGTLGALIGAISYPLLVIAMACVIIVYLNHTVFNQFRAIKPVTTWPIAGQQLVALADIIQNWWWLVIAIAIIIIMLMRKVMVDYTGPFRATLDQIPPFSLYRRISAARLMETLGLLVENGVVFKAAIKVMQYQANPYVTYHLVTMEHTLSMGKGNLADVLNTGLISEKDILRLRVMAEVKGFEHGLVRMGVHGSEEVTVTMKIISRILGGILLAVGGLMVIMIIRGIYMTSMSMSSV